MAKKIIISAVTIVIVLLTALTAWQWNNISAFIDGIRYDEEQIEKMASVSQDDVNRHMDEISISVTPLTPEEDGALQNGDITEEEAIAIMTGKTTFEEVLTGSDVQDKSGTGSDVQDKSGSKEISGPNNLPDSKNDGGISDITTGSDDNEKQPVQDDTPVNDKAGEPAKDSPEKEPLSEDEADIPEADYDALISEKVAQLYVIKSNFYGQFNAEWARYKAMFLQLPKNEQTRARIAEIVKECVPQGVAMEKECDAQVNEVLKELKALLKEAGRDTSLADSIKSAYESEKKSMKAKLINKYF